MRRVCTPLAIVVVKKGDGGTFLFAVPPLSRLNKDFGNEVFIFCARTAG